jgi:hypothetical protein
VERKVCNFMIQNVRGGSYLVVLGKLLHKLQMKERTNLVLMLAGFFYCFGPENCLEVYEKSRMAILSLKK